MQARVAVDGRELGVDLAPADRPRGGTGLLRPAAAALRRAARRLAALRGAGIPRLGRARRELQLRADHPHPALQRHAHRVRRPPDARAPRRLPRWPPPGLVPALLVSVTPVPGAECDERTLPPPQPGDLLVTRARARARCAGGAAVRARARW